MNKKILKNKKTTRKLTHSVKLVSQVIQPQWVVQNETILFTISHYFYNIAYQYNLGNISNLFITESFTSSTQSYKSWPFRIVNSFFGQFILLFFGRFSSNTQERIRTKRPWKSNWLTIDLYLVSASSSFTSTVKANKQPD